MPTETTADAKCPCGTGAATTYCPACGYVPNISGVSEDDPDEVSTGQPAGRNDNRSCVNLGWVLPDGVRFVRYQMFEGRLAIRLDIPYSDAVLKGARRMTAGEAQAFVQRILAHQAPCGETSDNLKAVAKGGVWKGYALYETLALQQMAREFAVDITPPTWHA